MEQIIPLRGPDRIRRRPAVIFGSDGLEGAKNALLTLLQIFLESALAGQCKKLEIEQHNDGSIAVISHDGGLDLGTPDGGNNSKWRDLFCELYANCRNLRQDEYAFPMFSRTYLSDLYGQELALPKFMPEPSFLSEFTAIQYVCSKMDVLVIRDGYESSLHFEKGYPVEDIVYHPTKEEALTKLHFTLDPEIFTDINIPQTFIQATLEQYAYLVPGLVCTFTNNTHAVTYCYPGGIREYVESRCKDAITPVFYEELFASGRDRYNKPEYDAYIRIALCFTKETSEQICIHKFRELTAGGAQYRKIQEHICEKLQLQFGDNLTWDEIASHIFLVVETGATDKGSAWENGRRNAISQQMITDMAADIMLPFYPYTNKHKIALFNSLSFHRS